MKKYISLLLAFLLLFATPSLVLADNDSGEGMSRNSIRQEVRQKVKSDLEDLRQRTCENRMETIKNRSESLSSRAEKMENHFSSIAERVENYYTTKLVPAGVTVSNYDSLVSDIATKKDAVDQALADAKDKATIFDCGDVSIARTKVTDYRAAMMKVITALKEYKTAIKNLIVAVRTAAKDLKPSPSPES